MWDRLRTQFLLLKGPSGTYSHFCTSRALQSFSSTNPNTCSAAAVVLIWLPISLPNPTKKACARRFYLS